MWILLVTSKYSFSNVEVVSQCASGRAEVKLYT